MQSGLFRWNWAIVADAIFVCCWFSSPSPLEVNGTQLYQVRTYRTYWYVHNVRRNWLSTFVHVCISIGTDKDFFYVKFIGVSIGSMIRHTLRHQRTHAPSAVSTFLGVSSDDVKVCLYGLIVLCQRISCVRWSTWIYDYWCLYVLYVIHTYLQSHQGKEATQKTPTTSKSNLFPFSFLSPSTNPFIIFEEQNIQATSSILFVEHGCQIR